ncbi:MAG: biotin--[acetyl-CoA-carboxylase] ligase [Phycisphaerae bacterium]
MNRANLVLEVLYDREEQYVPFIDLVRESGLPPEEVTRSLEILQRRGHAIANQPTHGFRLERPIRLEPHLIERDLMTRRIGKSVICFDEVDSTNDTAMDSARQQDTDGLVILAESQRKGRGRLGRRWVSPPGSNILMSVLLNSTSALPQEAVTIAAGLSIAEAAEWAGVPDCSLKWPNDVEIGGRKLAGVLVEASMKGDRQTLVIGMGINVNSCPPEDQVDRPATSIRRQLRHKVERTELVQAVLRRLDTWVTRIQNGRTERLHREWTARCGMINRRITVRSAQSEHTGRVLDVSPLEGLLLLEDTGRRVYLQAAGTTVIR